MATGKKEELEATHARMTRVYLRILEQMDPESPFYNKDFCANPAIFGHINKWMLQNDIKAVATASSPLEKLREQANSLHFPFLNREKGR